MQYILTQEEYDNLTPASELVAADAKVELLNDLVMELSGYKCHHVHPGFRCDECPIGGFGPKGGDLRTCTKRKRFSK